MLMINKIVTGSERTIKAKKNIIAALLFKGCSIGVSMILIPLTLGYLTSYEYGVWITLSTMLHWIDFFDIGLGNGLRNKLSESLANNDISKSRILISTTFVSLGILVGVFYLIFLILNIWIDWYDILNVSIARINNLKAIVLFVSAMMCINFILKTITFIYYAKQVAMMNNAIAFITQLFSLIVIFCLTKLTSGSLLYISCVFSLSPVVILGLFYPFTFFYKYKELAPSISSVRVKYFKELISLGLEFFFLKIGGLLIFSTSNIFISNILSPENVTTYSISQKYFSLLSMIYSIIITPMWSASTEAYVKNDYKWLQNSCKSMMKIEMAFIIGSVLMCIFADDIYKFWLGSNVVPIPTSLNICFALYVAVFNISSCYSTFIFGMGKLKIQLYSTFISGVLFVSIATICIQEFGIQGAFIALIIANLPALVLNPIQFFIIVRQKCNKSSIWYK